MKKKKLKCTKISTVVKKTYNDYNKKKTKKDSLFVLYI